MTPVSLDRQILRFEICIPCELKTTDPFGRPNCGVCTCKLQGGNTIIEDLIKYEEETMWGCKHPNGSKWQKAGV